MSRCAECGTQQPADEARFCGSCGALLDRPSRSVDTPAAASRRRWWAGGVLVAVLLAVVVVLVGPWSARPAPVLWERAGRADLPLADLDVVPAGPHHVLVAGRVLTTTDDEDAARLRQVPATIADSALDGGRWALVEGGALVTGSMADGVLDRSRVPTGPAIGGAARAWAEGDPVLTGEDGHLVRLGPGGDVVWWTAWPVTAVLATGERWLLGEDGRGATVAVAVADGTLTPLPGRPLAVVGDVAVLRRDGLVVGVDVPTGAERWQRPDGGGAWRALAGQLVVEGATRVARVDLATGATTGQVVGDASVAVADGVVVRRADELVAVDWDGSVAWTRPLDTGTDHRLVAIDATRVALRSVTEAGVAVAVVDAAQGATLATTTPLPAPLQVPGAADGVVGLVLPGRAAPLVLDVATGASLDRPTPPLRRDRFETAAGTQAIDAGTVTVRAVGPDGAWRALLDAPVATVPVPLAASLDLATTDGTVQRLDRASGTVRWRTRLDGLPTALAATGPAVHVGTADGRVITLDERGAVTRRFRVGTPVAAIAATDGVLVVVTADGVVRGYAR